MLKHIIWDWNGPLVDARWLCIEGINCSLKKRGLSEITDDVYKDMFTFPVEHYYKKVGFDFTNGLGDRYTVQAETGIRRLHWQVPQILDKLFI